MFSTMTIIVVYIPIPTYIILILGVIYLINRRYWIEDQGIFRKRSLTILILMISCSLLNMRLLTIPIFEGSGFVSSLPQLLMLIWPDLLVLIVLIADMIRTCGLYNSRE